MGAAARGVQAMGTKGFFVLLAGVALVILVCIPHESVRGAQLTGGMASRIELVSSAQQVVRVCPHCDTAGASASASMASIQQDIANTASLEQDALASPAQQLASLPDRGRTGTAQAFTQQLPYKISGDLEIPQASISTEPTTTNPAVAIRFTQVPFFCLDCLSPDVVRTIADTLS